LSGAIPGLRGKGERRDAYFEERNELRIGERRGEGKALEEKVYVVGRRLLQVEEPLESVAVGEPTGV